MHTHTGFRFFILSIALSAAAHFSHAREYGLGRATCTIAAANYSGPFGPGLTTDVLINFQTVYLKGLIVLYPDTVLYEPRDCYSQLLQACKTMVSIEGFFQHGYAATSVHIAPNHFTCQDYKPDKSFNPKDVGVAKGLHFSHSGNPTQNSQDNFVKDLTLMPPFRPGLVQPQHSVPGFLSPTPEAFDFKPSTPNNTDESAKAFWELGKILILRTAALPAYLFGNMLNNVRYIYGEPSAYPGSASIIDDIEFYQKDNIGFYQLSNNDLNVTLNIDHDLNWVYFNEEVCLSGKTKRLVNQNNVKVFEFYDVAPLPCS